MSHRLERVSELIRSEVSDLLLRGIRDPRVAGLVTVTGVEVSGDLRLCKVFVSVVGSDQERARTLQGLRSARTWVRREVAHRVKLRSSPEIDFLLDDSLERGTRVLSLMKELGLGEEPEGAAEPEPEGEADAPGREDR
jgi:ribosome-binding factor A